MFVDSIDVFDCRLSHVTCSEVCKKYPPFLINPIQGRRRVFKSGPAEEIIEGRWHERGNTSWGLPLSLGGLGGSPPARKF